MTIWTRRGIVVILFFGERELHDLIVELNKENINLHVHSVGDKSTHKLLNAVEQAHESLGRAPVIRIAICIGRSGAGIGFVNNPAIQRIIAVAPEGEKQMAGTSVQAVRNIGVSFGAAASGMVAASAGLIDGADRATVAFAMEWVFGVNFVAAALALVIAIPQLARRRKRNRQAT